MATGRAKVWIVEDNATEAAQVVATLRTDMDCEIVTDGPRGVERIAAGDAPDVLIVDWQMSGLEFFRVAPAAICLLEGTEHCFAFANERVESSAKRGVALVTDLLDFTQPRLGAGIPVTLVEGDLHAVVDQVAEDASFHADAHQVRVSTTGDARGLWDLGRLTQAIDNVVTNAVKYGTPGNVIDVTSEAGADEIAIAIHNEGAPIAPEVMATMFAPMQRGVRTGDAARSVGLGLFIARHLVEAHGGHITAESGDAG